MPTFKVVDTFQIAGRGLVVATDKTYEAFSGKEPFKVGDAVEVRQDGRTILRTYVAGLELCTPWSPQQPIPILLPPEITKQNIPIGAELRISPATGAEG